MHPKHDRKKNSGSESVTEERVKESLYQLGLRTHSHLAEVDGEDGMRAGALGVHLCAGGGPGQGAEFQALEELKTQSWVNVRSPCSRLRDTELKPHYPSATNPKARILRGKLACVLSFSSYSAVW